MEYSEENISLTLAGCPQPRDDSSIQLRDGSGGGLVLLQDTQLIETLAHFARERIPERWAPISSKLADRTFH